MTVFLIGGPARVGKSTLHRLLRRQFDGDAIDVDPLVPVMETWGNKRYNEHDLLFLAPHHWELSVMQWVKQLRYRDRARWQGYRAWILEHQRRHGGNILATGPFWPGDIARLATAGQCRKKDTQPPIDYRAVILIDTSPRHVERVRAITRQPATPSNNWLAGRSDDWLTE